MAMGKSDTGLNLFWQVYIFILHVWRVNTVIYQTNKIRNFVFCLERFISSREINPFSRNSFFLTTGDPRHR